MEPLVIKKLIFAHFFFIYFLCYSTKRAGVLGIKLGVIPQWTKDGTKVFTTLVQVRFYFLTSLFILYSNIIRTDY